MRYRREGGILVGGPYNAPQDFATEELPDSDPEVVAFLAAKAALAASLAAGHTKDSADIAALKAIPEVLAFMQMSPAEADAWILANIGTGNPISPAQIMNLVLALRVLVQVNSTLLRAALR